MGTLPLCTEMSTPFNWALTNPLYAYGIPAFLFDTVLSQYSNGIASTTNFSTLSGLTFTRASVGYAQTSAGVLQQFASGVPRITDKGLLIKGARTNLATYSNDWTDVSWSKSNVTVTAAAAVAPDGTTTAVKLAATTGVSTTIVKNCGAVAATAAAYSIYVKKGSGATDANKFILRNLTTATILVNGTINYDTGAWTTTTGNAALVSALGGGWYRITLYATSGITSGDSIQIYTCFTGSAETAGEYAYVWGAQLEAAAFPSSYIPTTSASATRAADVASIAVSGIVAPYPMFAEIEVTNIGVQRDVISLGTLVDGAGLYIGAAERFVGWVRESSVTTALMTPGGTAMTVGVLQRGAARFAINNSATSNMGSAVATDISVTPASNLTTLYLGNAIFAGVSLFGYLKRAAIWSNLAMTDAALQQVST